MSTALPSVAEASPAVRGFSAVLNDWSQLVKIRVTLLVVMTAWCGFYMAAVKSELSSVSVQLFHALLGIALVSAGTATLNEFVEREVDARMRRTAGRPIPAGHISAATAAAFGGILVFGGAAYLGVTTNWLTAILALLTTATYLGVYTPLKQISPLCTFVGAFPGAMPPVLGWTAIRGRLEWEALALFAIMFLWQFPHFHAIAWLYSEDYERAGIRMLPVVEKQGIATKREILLYSLTLIPVSLAPTFLFMSGRMYLAAALLLTLGYFAFGLRLYRLQLAPADPQSKKTARDLLRASVIYLPLLFAALMLNAGRL